MKKPLCALLAILLLIPAFAVGEEALPDFYMDGLEIAPTLKDLADDLLQGCPMVRGNKIFDGDWDQKYLHGGF